MLGKQRAEGEPRKQTIQEDDKDPRSRIIKHFSAPMASNVCNKDSQLGRTGEKVSIPFIKAKIMSDPF